jgi:hypothetical protein
LTGDQQETVAALARYDLATLVVPPGADAVRFSQLFNVGCAIWRVYPRGST